MVLREILAEPPAPLPLFQALLGYVTRPSGLPGARLCEVSRGEQQDAGWHSLAAGLSWDKDMDMGCTSQQCHHQLVCQLPLPDVPFFFPLRRGAQHPNGLWELGRAPSARRLSWESPLHVRLGFLDFQHPALPYSHKRIKSYSRGLVGAHVSSP